MMKRLYRGLAYLIAAGVVLQAAAIAYAVFGMFEWVAAGGTIDKALIESEDPQIGGITGFNLTAGMGLLKSDVRYDKPVFGAGIKDDHFVFTPPKTAKIREIR